MPKIHRHLATGRYHVLLEDEPGRPEVSCDTLEQLDAIMTLIETHNSLNETTETGAA